VGVRVRCVVGVRGERACAGAGGVSYGPAGLG